MVEPSGCVVVSVTVPLGRVTVVVVEPSGFLSVSVVVPLEEPPDEEPPPELPPLAVGLIVVVQVSSVSVTVRSPSVAVIYPRVVIELALPTALLTSLFVSVPEIVVLIEESRIWGRLFASAQSNWLIAVLVSW